MSADWISFGGHLFGSVSLFYVSHWTYLSRFGFVFINKVSLGNLILLDCSFVDVQGKSFWALFVFSGLLVATG